jgi:RHS repeat-associated protein
MEKNGQKYYYHFDGLGSVTALTDSTVNIVQRYDYDSFGNITYMLDPNFIQPYTYTGREYDPEAGSYYYRARYYNSKIGRFISEDPIGLKGGINQFAYVGNNPVNWVDPLGLYGTKDCSYYQQACETNGGIYECYIAEKACNFFPKNNETSNCIRQCLQEKHKKRQPEGQCSEEGQTGWGDFSFEHYDCFKDCLQNPENPYDPKGPDLPDQDIRLY